MRGNTSMENAKPQRLAMLWKTHSNALETTKSNNPSQRKTSNLCGKMFNANCRKTAVQHGQKVLKTTKKATPWSPF